jgi:hypothetical protein
MVAKIDEQDPAEIAPIVQPTRQPDLLADLRWA